MYNVDSWDILIYLEREEEHSNIYMIKRYCSWPNKIISLKSNTYYDNYSYVIDNL